MSWPEKVDEILSLKRKHQTLQIEMPYQNTQVETRTFEIFKRHGGNLKNLDLSQVCFNDNWELCEVLSKMPMLKSLKLSSVNFKATDNSCDLENFCLRNLTSLSISFGCFTFLQFLTAPKMKSLKLFGKSEGEKAFD